MSKENHELEVKALLAQQDTQKEFDIQDVVNSKIMNQKLLHNVQEMFDLEFEIKMRA